MTRTGNIPQDTSKKLYLHILESGSSVQLCYTCVCRTIIFSGIKSASISKFLGPFTVTQSYNKSLITKAVCTYSFSAPNGNKWCEILLLGEEHYELH